MRTIVAGGLKTKKAVTLLHLRLPRPLPLGQKASAIGNALEVGPHAVQVHEIGDELVGLRSDDQVFQSADERESTTKGGRTMSLT